MTYVKLHLRVRHPKYHCIKSVLIWGFPGPSLVRMWKNMDQEHSGYERFL